MNRTYHSACTALPSFCAIDRSRGRGAVVAGIGVAVAVVAVAATGGTLYATWDRTVPLAGAAANQVANWLTPSSIRPAHPTADAGDNGAEHSGADRLESHATALSAAANPWPGYRSPATAERDSEPNLPTVRQLGGLDRRVKLAPAWSDRTTLSPYRTVGTADSFGNWAGWVYASDAAADTGAWKWRLRSNYPASPHNRADNPEDSPDNRDSAADPANPNRSAAAAASAAASLPDDGAGANLYVLDAGGSLLWGRRSGAPLGGGAVTYTVNGPGRGDDASGRLGPIGQIGPVGVGRGVHLASAGMPNGFTANPWPTPVVTGKIATPGATDAIRQPQLIAPGSPGSGPSAPPILTDTPDPNLAPPPSLSRISSFLSRVSTSPLAN